MTANRQISTRAGLTLVEVMVAMLVVMVAVPPLIEAATSLARWDRARDLRSHATHFQQIALERAHYEMYNRDTRGYRLTDGAGQRRTKYSATPPGWQTGLSALAVPSGAVVDATAQSGAPVARTFQQLFERDAGGGYPYAVGASPPAPVGGGMTVATHNDMVMDVPSYRVAMSAAPVDVTTDPALSTKLPADPKADLVRLDVIIRWTDFRGGQREQRTATWRTRPVAETDPTLTITGGL